MSYWWGLKYTYKESQKCLNSAQRGHTSKFTNSKVFGVQIVIGISFFKKIPNSWEGLGELAWNYPIGNTMILNLSGLFLISVSLTSWLSRLSVSWPPAGFPVYGVPVLPELPYSSVVWPCVSKSSAAGLFGSDTDPPAASFRADSTSSHLDRNSHTVRY